MRSAWLGILGIAWGCGMSEDRFITKFANASCEALAECDSEALVDHWGDQAGCTVAYGDFLRTWSVDCDDYDKKKAKACIKALKSMDCGDLEDGVLTEECEDVWSDCEGHDTGG